MGVYVKPRYAWSMPALLWCLVILWATALSAGPKAIFKARLSYTPMNAAMKANIAGSGSVTAVLTGSRLVLTGSFKGLRSPATHAQIHRGPRGIRGPVIFDLSVTKATSGSIHGTLDLAPSEVTDLKNAGLYVQLDSERAPGGNLWGWFFEAGRH